MAELVIALAHLGALARAATAVLTQLSCGSPSPPAWLPGPARRRSPRLNRSRWDAVQY